MSLVIELLKKFARLDFTIRSFFRDEKLTHEEHIAFAACFGELHIHPTVPRHPKHPELIVIHADENSHYVAGAGWHSEGSFEAIPPMGSILRLTEAPPDGGGVKSN